MGEHQTPLRPRHVLIEDDREQPAGSGSGSNSSSGSGSGAAAAAVAALPLPLPLLLLLPLPLPAGRYRGSFADRRAHAVIQRICASRIRFVTLK